MLNVFEHGVKASSVGRELFCRKAQKLLGAKLVALVGKGIQHNGASVFRKAPECLLRGVIVGLSAANKPRFHVMSELFALTSGKSAQSLANAGHIVYENNGVFGKIVKSAGKLPVGNGKISVCRRNTKSALNKLAVVCNGVKKFFGELCAVLSAKKTADLCGKPFSSAVCKVGRKLACRGNNKLFKVFGPAL